MEKNEVCMYKIERRCHCMDYLFKGILSTIVSIQQKYYKVAKEEI